MSKPGMGPNVRRLIAERAAQLQIEAAKAKYGGVGVGEIAASMADDNLAGFIANTKTAAKWVQDALAIVRAAPGSEKWPTDEDMAGEILNGIEARRKR